MPNRGEAYGPANPKGMIQLDMVGLFGLALVRSYEVVGKREWLGPARHWAEVLAAKRCRQPGAPPWNRYANPEDVPWNDVQTGGVVMLLNFFDELLRVGGKDEAGRIAEARDAARHYLSEVLLPRWLQDDTWGRDYWDWEHQVQGEDFSEMVPRYLMAHPDLFPNWRADARNIPLLFWQRACVSTNSDGGVYSGAWAYPEGSQCCGRSLSYAPMQVGAAIAEYGTRADSPWARELARRQFLLATYDCLETGVVEDGMDGGSVVAGNWFQIAHPLPLKYALDGIGWLPGTLGANRENHLVRSSAVVTRVTYGAGLIAYTTYDAPRNTSEVLRLAFAPTRITADGQPLKRRTALTANGYTQQGLPNGDCIIELRHDGRTRVTIEGDDPQRALEEGALAFNGDWAVRKPENAARSDLHLTAMTNASMTCTFEGNQLRLLGAVGREGGLAEVYLDDTRQLCGIDFWNPRPRSEQVVYYRNGLSNGRHTLKVVALGRGNPRSAGAWVMLGRVLVSAASGSAGFGEGGGSPETQRWLFGYPERNEYKDSAGHLWRPATEVVIRSGHLADSVAASWYTRPRRQFVTGTADPALYAYGMHGRDFTAYCTVAPGTYYVRLKLLETRLVDPEKRRMDIEINGALVARSLDIAATASGLSAPSVSVGAKETRAAAGINTATDLVFDGISPQHGVIAVRFTGCDAAEATVSALEVGSAQSRTQ